MNINFILKRFNNHREIVIATIFFTLLFHLIIVGFYQLVLDIELIDYPEKALNVAAVDFVFGVILYLLLSKNYERYITTEEHLEDKLSKLKKKMGKVENQLKNYPQNKKKDLIKLTDEYLIEINKKIIDEKNPEVLKEFESIINALNNFKAIFKIDNKK